MSEFAAVDEDLDLPPDPSGMTEEEASLAADLYHAVQAAATSTERTRQAQQFLLGISDLGTCSERTRRMLAAIPEPIVSDKLEAFLGTAIGDHVEAAIRRLYPEVKTQQTVEVSLQGDGGTYVLDGHPDLIHPWGVGDCKTTDGLEVVRRTGPSQQQLFQRHLYALGAHQAGFFGDLPLEQVKTYNIWFDRSGRTKQSFVHMDTYNPEIVAAATMWLDDVVYAWKHGEEAHKEPPRAWCQKVCGHFTDCRLFDSDVSGLITDPDITAALALHQEGLAMEKRGKAMKKEATAALEGVEGYARGEDGVQFQVRWTRVGPSQVSFTRKPYDRLTVTKVK